MYHYTLTDITTWTFKSNYIRHYNIATLWTKDNKVRRGVFAVEWGGGVGLATRLMTLTSECIAERRAALLIDGLHSGASWQQFAHHFAVAVKRSSHQRSCPQLGESSVHFCTSRQQQLYTHARACHRSEQCRSSQKWIQRTEPFWFNKYIIDIFGVPKPKQNVKISVQYLTFSCRK